jgi:hypothetical protein
MHPARTLWFACTVVVAALAGSATTAHARPKPARGEAFEANKGFGLGLMLGAPTGLSLKYYLDESHALDAGVGVSRYLRHGRRDGLHLHADYLWHPVVLAKADPFWVPLYFGLGARLFDFDDYDDRDGDHDGTAIGLRAPIGVMLDFNEVPVDVFLEFALVVDLLVSTDDHADVDLNGALGARYYFN